MNPVADRTLPLYVDLDGTLIRSDSLWDSLALALHRPDAKLLAAPLWVIEGAARFKDHVSRYAVPNAALLPYREDLLDWLREEKAAGRRIVLATAAHEKIASSVAEHLGCFDRVLASTPTHNLKGANKLAAILEDCEGKGFAYAGDSPPDLKIWARATTAILAGKATNRESRLHGEVVIEKRFPDAVSPSKALIKIIRPHQWAKNILVFLPLIAAHRVTDIGLIAMTFGVFLSFSWCASSVYILNDFVDIENDREHARKKRRPLAAGTLGAPVALATSATLLILAVALCASISIKALAVLVIYWIATCLYSFALKRRVLLDAFVLAGLYVARSAAGAALLKDGLSEWMTAFLIFLFLSLAFAKRFTELKSLSEKGSEKVKGRGYRAADMLPVGVFGVAAAFTSSLVIALYVTGNTVSALYHRPGYLWLVALLAIYWLCRIWLKCWRGELHEDPVVFALKDRVTYLIALLLGGVLLLAGPV